MMGKISYGGNGQELEENTIKEDTITLPLHQSGIWGKTGVQYTA